MTEAERIEHNRAFQRAAALVENEILLHERQFMPPPGIFLRWRLTRALKLLARVLELKTQNYAALWMAGKTHQRLGSHDKAFAFLERSYQANPSQSDVAREASMLAMDLGNLDAAIVYAHRATQIEPENPGLHANLALSYLLANKLREAAGAISKSLELDAKDEISKSINTLIAHFSEGATVPPRTTRSLQLYWAQHLKLHPPEKK